MSPSLAQSVQTVFSFPASTFPPLALGFFGLGTGYMIYGTQELFGFPARSERVDFATGMWGIWMPGFLQFITGIYLFTGLALFNVFVGLPPLYMAALAFTAYGVHWFAIGWNRLRQADPGSRSAWRSRSRSSRCSGSLSSSMRTTTRSAACSSA